MKKREFRASDSLGNPSVFVGVVKTVFPWMPPETVSFLLSVQFVGANLVRKIRIAASSRPLAIDPRAPLQSRLVELFDCPIPECSFRSCHWSCCAVRKSEAAAKDFKQVVTGTSESPFRFHLLQAAKGEVRELQH